MKNWYNKILNYELIVIDNEMYYIYEELRQNNWKSWYINFNSMKWELKTRSYYYNYKTFYKWYLEIYDKLWIRWFRVIKEITRKRLKRYM